MKHTLADWLAWLEGLDPSHIELGLERVASVAQALALPKPAPQVITVAGTNGKGSVVAALQAILGRAGWRVGSYTSPHLLRYNERVMIDGKPVADADLVAAFAAVDNARGETALTYFEFGTLAALWLFARAELDAVVLEVGLGGRLDAVNIIDPDIAVITAVDLDHQAYLGNDRETIGAEKAGILRPGIPLVLADPTPPESVLDRAQALDCACYRWPEHFAVDPDGLARAWYQGQAYYWHGLPLPMLPLPSVGAALQVAALLDVRLAPASLRALLAELTLPGRMQTLLARDREWLLDVAHNPHAARLLAERLAATPRQGKTLAVTAVMADKDFDQIFAPLTPLVDYWLVTGLPQVRRAAVPERLMASLQGRGAPVEAQPDLPAALAVARKRARAGDRILVFGSFYTVAGALAWLTPATPESESNG